MHYSDGKGLESPDPLSKHLKRIRTLIKIRFLKIGRMLIGNRSDPDSTIYNNIYKYLFNIITKIQ